MTILISLIVTFKGNLDKYLAVQPTSPWVPSSDCPGFPANYSENMFVVQKHSTDNDTNPNSFYITFLAVSQIIVSVIYPLLALILFIEIRNSARRVMDINLSESLDRTRSSKMIFYLTVSYIVSSVPRGVIWVFHVFVQSVSVESFLEMFLGYGTIITSAFFCLNATLQCVICFVLSSRYRETARSLLRMKQREITVYEPTPMP
ncbi:hypothetical protein CRE_09143 [Caenorhabditis remanei]|uniref:Uncharacterized protein n=1 Tax=Caenorhabditis remanei TaxID=31234 RepID=E3LJJ9_CAERE|nr:hypothetical protein CRE_09143 [Caenorhabditis remanei]